MMNATQRYTQHQESTNMLAHLWCWLEHGKWDYWQVNGPVMLLERSVPAAASSLQEEEAQTDWIDGPASELAALVGDAHDRNVVLLPVTASQHVEWALMATPAACVFRNGQPLATGLAMLSDRDEIVTRDTQATRRWYFSNQQLAHIAPAPRGQPTCPRCKSGIKAGTPAVRCPACGVWHHQALGDLECWSYMERCGACHKQDTHLDGQVRWSPVEL
jgi:hypothetical protein